MRTNTGGSAITCTTLLLQAHVALPCDMADFHALVALHRVWHCHRPRQRHHRLPAAGHRGDRRADRGAVSSFWLGKLNVIAVLVVDVLHPGTGLPVCAKRMLAYQMEIAS